MAVDPSSTQNNATARIAFRVVGAVLLIAGAVIAIIGLTQFASDFGSTDPGNDGPGSIFMTAGGAFLALFGLTALRMGFLRAGVNYVVGETGDAIRTVAADVATGVRSVQPQAGPFCSKCGTRNDVAAHFCDACGSPLAQ
ncbi:MAG: zinc-ribbon domain-containing protein [Marmoricola sp.]